MKGDWFAEKRGGKWRIVKDSAGRNTQPYPFPDAVEAGFDKLTAVPVCLPEGLAWEWTEETKGAQSSYANHWENPPGFTALEQAIRVEQYKQSLKQKTKPKKRTKNENQ